jgi:hypothetical protein
VLDLLTLVIAYMARYFVSDNDDQLKYLITLDEPVLEDQNDFGGRSEIDNDKDRTICDRLPKQLYRMAFFNFPTLFLVFFCLSCSTMTSGYTTDLIKVIYLGFLISFILRYNKLFKHNKIMLSSFRLFNLGVVLTYLGYQIPFFPC